MVNYRHSRNMGPSHVENDHRQPAACRNARRLLCLIVLTGALSVLMVAADLLLDLSNRDDAAAAWMQTLTLTTPALWQAGSPARHPETVHPGVDLRFSPGLESAP